MLEVIIGLTVAFILWNLRGAFYNQSEVWKEKVDLTTKDSRVDLQEDYKALHDRVLETRKANGDKWFTMKDIEESMK